MVVIVIVGAGVTGLTTALLLSESRSNEITVVAKHMPGDKDAEYASPWAGANFLPMATKEESKWERLTWPELKRLAQEVPEAGIHLQKARVYRRNKDTEATGNVPMDPLFSTDPWYKDLATDYRELRPDEMIPGHDSGCEFGSVCINTGIYLSWLVGQCVKNGVVFRRGILNSIHDAKGLSHTGEPARVVVNATGLGSRTLGGVEDAAMIPARGQTVLVRNSCRFMIVSSGTDDEPSDMLYTMERAVGGGTIIGGTYDFDNADPQPDQDVALRIMTRAVRAWPELADGRGVKGLSVISHGVGLRPYRRGGVRLEREALDDGTWVVHNYGHAGWGYQGSYGCAERAIELVNEVCGP